MEHAQRWLVTEFKKMRFMPHATDNGAEEWDKAQVTFPTQESAQKFVARIPAEIKQDLGLRLEGDLATGTTSLIVRHAAFRKLMAQDFLSYVTQDTPSQASL